MRGFGVHIAHDGDDDVAADVILFVEGHGLGGVDLADFAGPADGAAAVVVGHVGGGHELLDEAADGIGVGAHAALFHDHVALLVELAGHGIGQAARLHPRPQLQAVFRHRPEVLRVVEAGFGVQAVRAVGFGNLSELVGDDEFLGLGLGVEKGLVQRLRAFLRCGR